MCPRTKEQFEEIREEKKTLIMNVALEHFAREGYFNTTISHIAKHAGISKGLLYNYFKSKEELLSEIIRRSVAEVYGYFDLNRDGFLTTEEFEFFIRRISVMLKQKKSVWLLFFQLLMQDEVREQFLRSFVGTGSLFGSAKDNKSGYFVSDIMKTISGYFIRKARNRPDNYDPYLDLNMFILTLKGFALTYIYTDNVEDEYFDKTVEAIISTYK
jgi:AcrR family transcriptional regulator